MWSVDRTRNLESRLRENGRDSEVHYYPGQGHMLDRQSTNIQNRRLIEFFTSALKENVTKERVLNQAVQTTPAKRSALGLRV
ncbi:MAG: hypothetical protein HRU10_10290 [Opitutales bacterium]|nr:hypothetical protein [Opitutales bacterium]